MVLVAVTTLITMIGAFWVLDRFVIAPVQIAKVYATTTTVEVPKASVTTASTATALCVPPSGRDDVEPEVRSKIVERTQQLS